MNVKQINEGFTRIFNNILEEDTRNEVYSKKRHLNEDTTDNKLFVVITQGGFIGGNWLNGKLFTSKEEAAEACKKWKNSFGSPRSETRQYYQPKTSIHVYKPGYAFDNAVKSNKSNKDLLDNYNESLDEALPKDLMGQIRYSKQARRRPNYFNTGYGAIRNDYDPETKDWTKPVSGVKDYQNATYREATPQEIMKMKKNGDSLEGVYIMKDGRMLALDNYGSVIQGDSTISTRANQSLKKSLDGADKIYIANIPDALDSQPDKMRARMSDEDSRDANMRLGHSRYDKISYPDKSRMNQEIDKYRKQYEDGDISRKEMENQIAYAKYRYGPSKYDYKEYQRYKNSNAKNRYMASQVNLQKPFNDLRDYRDQLRNSKYQLERDKKDLEIATTGNAGNNYAPYDSYARAKQEVEKLTKQIAYLQHELAEYQAQIDGGLQNKDIADANARIDQHTQEIQYTQDKIDKLLRRKP